MILRLARIIELQIDDENDQYSAGDFVIYDWNEEPPTLMRATDAGNGQLVPVTVRRILSIAHHKTKLSE